jgi:hypothetical protein
MFYCSLQRNAPFFEVDSQVGDRLVLSEWKKTSHLLVNNVGYSKPNFKALASNRECPDWSGGKDLKYPDLRDQQRPITEFLADLFCMNVPDGREYLYKPTIAIAEKFVPADVRHGAVTFDGLMYPTIPMAGNCENVALRPQFVDRGLAFVKAEYIVVRNVQGTRLTFDVLDFANSVSPSGNLHWKGRPPQWQLSYQGEELTFAAEDGQWVARRPDGTIEDPM